MDPRVPPDDPQETARVEPVLASVADVGEFDETARLDPNRATAEREPPPARWQRGLSLGVFGSLGVHLLPLLLLLEWSSPPAEVAAPIPVQLVIEAPPPPPPPAPKPEEFKRPPPGPLASEDFGEPAAKSPETAAEPPPSPPAPTQMAAAAEPAPTQMAAVVLPPPSPAAPTPFQMAAAVPPPPKPVRPPKPAALASSWHRLDTNPQDASHEGKVPGPAATRDEYLAYCMSLIRRHFGLLPRSFIAGRRGVTMLRVVVFDDGTIGAVTPAQNSPYADIDARIAEAVRAVHRFPPLPQRFQGPGVGLVVVVPYPEGL